MPDFLARLGIISPGRALSVNRGIRYASFGQFPSGLGAIFQKCARQGSCAKYRGVRGIEMSGKDDPHVDAILGCFEALYRTAFRLTGNKARAEDLIQETYLRAWRSLSQLHDLSGVQPWMFRILRAVFIDQLRKESSRPKLVMDVEKMLAAYEELSPPEIFDVNDRGKLEELFDWEITSAIAELPEEERLALLFQAVGNLTYCEISEALGCPIGTVMSRLHRAKRWLRLRLAAYARDCGFIRSTPGKEDQRDAKA
jgi:RNA polymerase sigma-70 factor (ECF subfamily)